MLSLRFILILKVEKALEDMEAEWHKLKLPVTDSSGAINIPNSCVKRS
jgi:hypothetical protein